MGGSRSKPVAESARSVIAKRNEVIANEMVAEVFTGNHVPGLSGKQPSVSSTMKTASVLKVYPGTGDVNPVVHSGLSKLDFVKMSRDTNFSKYQMDMQINPQASVVREKEIKSLILEQKNKGIFDGTPLKAPGKISEEELTIVLRQIKNGGDDHLLASTSKEFGLEEAQIKLILQKCVAVPVIAQEMSSDGMILVAR